MLYGAGMVHIGNDRITDRRMPRIARLRRHAEISQSQAGGYHIKNLSIILQFRPTLHRMHKKGKIENTKRCQQRQQVMNRSLYSLNRRHAQLLPCRIFDPERMD